MILILLKKVEGKHLSLTEIGLKEYKQNRTFFPFSRLIKGRVRPFSSAGTALTQCGERSG